MVRYMLRSDEASYSLFTSPLHVCHFCPRSHYKIFFPKNFWISFCSSKGALIGIYLCGRLPTHHSPSLPGLLDLSTLGTADWVLLCRRDLSWVLRSSAASWLLGTRCHSNPLSFAPSCGSDECLQGVSNAWIPDAFCSSCTCLLAAPKACSAHSCSITSFKSVQMLLFSACSKL